MIIQDIQINPKLPLNNYIFDIVKKDHIQVRALMEKIEYGLLEIDLKYRTICPYVLELWYAYCQFRSVTIRHLANEEIIVFPLILDIERKDFDKKEKGILGSVVPEDINKIIEDRLKGEHDQMIYNLDSALSLLDNNELQECLNIGDKKIRTYITELKDNLVRHGKVEDDILYIESVKMYNELYDSHITLANS